MQPHKFDSSRVTGQMAYWDLLVRWRPSSHEPRMGPAISIARRKLLNAPETTPL